MKFSSNALFMGLALITTVFVSCSSDDDKNESPTSPAENQLILINSAETDQGGMLVNIYAKDSLQAQYTKLYVEVKDTETDEVISHAQVSVVPIMDMEDMSHSAPFENPESDQATNGKFETAVVFTMPGDMGWELEVYVYDFALDREGTATIPVSVGQPVPSRTHVVTPLDDGNKLVISYLLPTQPKVGVNDFEITIHERITGMDFQPVEDYSVTINPDMPSMGHGSPNNVNPVHIANGHYKGKVNFTMTGMWRIELGIYDGTTPKDTASYFDITF